MPDAFDPAVEAAKLNSALLQITEKPCFMFSSFTRKLNHEVVTRLAITVEGRVQPNHLLRPHGDEWEIYQIGGSGTWGAFSAKALECLLQNAGRKPSKEMLEWGYSPQRHYIIALRKASAERLI